MNANALQSLEQRQLFLRILIFSFFIAILAVVASIVFSQKRTGISPELQTLAAPLNPNIHFEVVDQIEQKRTFSQSELENFHVYRLIKNTAAGDRIE